jgi:hypothetical protein
MNDAVFLDTNGLIALLNADDGCMKPPESYCGNSIPVAAA